MKTLDEQVAEKMGWKQSPTMMWEQPGPSGRVTSDEDYAKGIIVSDSWMHSYPPKFSSDWNATKILIKFMRERGYEYGVRGDVFYWWIENYGVISEGSAEIIDDNLPLAACEAFLQLDLEGK